MLADKPTELSRIKLKNFNSTARPYDQRAISPLDPTAVWHSHLALAIYMFVVVNFDALAQASTYMCYTGYEYIDSASLKSSCFYSLWTEGIVLTHLLTVGVAWIFVWLRHFSAIYSCMTGRSGWFCLWKLVNRILTFEVSCWYLLWYFDLYFYVVECCINQLSSAQRNDIIDYASVLTCVLGEC